MTNSAIQRPLRRSGDTRRAVTPPAYPRGHPFDSFPQPGWGGGGHRVVSGSPRPMAGIRTGFVTGPREHRWILYPPRPPARGGGAGAKRHLRSGRVPRGGDNAGNWCEQWCRREAPGPPPQPPPRKRPPSPAVLRRQESRRAGQWSHPGLAVWARLPPAHPPRERCWEISGRGHTPPCPQQPLPTGGCALGGWVAGD